MNGESDNNRSEGQGGSREALSAKEVRSKGTTVGKRTGSEAAMRAMSVLENAKSNRHRKTHRVDPDGTGRKFMHLTRGDLPRESAGEVSRGRSSQEGRESGWSEGPKNPGRQSTDRPTGGRRGVPRNALGAAIVATAAAAATRRGGERQAGGPVPCPNRAEASLLWMRKEVEEDA